MNKKGSALLLAISIFTFQVTVYAQVKAAKLIEQLHGEANY